MMLGKALCDAGDAEGAIAAFRQSVALNPGCAVVKELAWTLAPTGGLEEARAAWEKILERDPPEHDNWYGYAPLCLFLGNEEAYSRAREALLKRFGDTTNDWIVAERTSLASLLLLDAGDELRATIRLADLAVAAGEKSREPGNPYLRFVKGLAVYRDGRPEDAVPLLLEAAEKRHDRAGPRLALAMAQFQSGSTSEARKTLAAAVRAYDWKAPRVPSHADQSTLWVSHVLRREAEAMILPNLQAFLRGNNQPQDNDERLALLGICQSRGRSRAAARLYADAFAVDPGLADSMMTECLRRAIQGHGSTADPMAAFNAACRYHAARSAALAGCGLGKDGDKLSAAERMRWHKQAREWLQADLAIRALSGSFWPRRRCASLSRCMPGQNAARSPPPHHAPVTRAGPPAHALGSECRGPTLRMMGPLLWICGRGSCGRRPATAASTSRTTAARSRVSANCPRMSRKCLTRCGFR